MKKPQSTPRHLRTQSPTRPVEKTAVRRQQDAAANGLDDALTNAARHWLHSMKCEPVAQRVQVCWNARLQTTAGTACVHTSRIELNPRLQEIGDRQIQRTLRHEVAHLVAHYRAGRRAGGMQTHGPEWRKACAELGIGDEPAFHDLPFRRREVLRRYAYQCPHCGLIVKRVQKFGRFTACYQCCKKHNGGVYTFKFQFVRVEMPSD